MSLLCLTYLFEDADTYDAVEPTLDPTRVSLPEDDFSSSGEACGSYSLSYRGMGIGSNMSLRTAVSGMTFGLALEGVAGDVVDDVHPTNSTILVPKEGSTNHTVGLARTEGLAVCSGYEDTSKDRDHCVASLIKWIPNLTGMLSAATAGIKARNEEIGAEST